MQTVNLKNQKYCLSCRYYSGALNPKLNSAGVFNVEPSNKSICYKTHFERLWNFSCDKWALKFELE
jgi:hypothetical protein